MTTTLNGWDVEAMTQAITMVKEQPEAGLLTWRGRSIWDGGFGLGRTHSRDRAAG
jgi:hypothetical protein